MAVDETVWRLPGPSSLVRDTRRELARGRHVVIVLPRWLARDEEFADTLAGALSRELGSLGVYQRVYPEADSPGGIASAIGEGLNAFDPTPATVAELVWHGDLSGHICLVLESDLDERSRTELPAFLQRLESESRGGAPSVRGSDERLRIVVVTTRASLPPAASAGEIEVGLSAVWWWNRVARWDVATHVAARSMIVTGHRILQDVRTDTIVEIARWQLELAAELSEHWSGDPEELKALLFPHRREGSEYGSAITSGARCGGRPADNDLNDWDAGRLDGWHDSLSPAAGWLLDNPDRLHRTMWSAQARILLPWIETQREHLQALVLRRVGKERFSRTLREVCDVPPADGEVVEIGPLKRVIDRLFRGAEPEWCNAARRLHRARNDLAHLLPMSIAAMSELVNACDALRD